MRKVILWIVAIVVTAGIAVFVTWYIVHPRQKRSTLTLYGNIDIRVVQAAFNDSEHIIDIRVEEGDRVKRGQVLARLKTDRLEASIEQARARVAAQGHVVQRLENGSRPQEIDQARADLAAAQAKVVQARQLYNRLEALVGTGATTEQDLDDARASLDVAEANERVAQKALDLKLIGPRIEVIEENRSTLAAYKAEVLRLERQLADATLISPTDGVIRNRILEPGDIATPQLPVFTIAKMDPKWVRTYVPESDLSKVQIGQPARVETDSYPGHWFDGWVGYISPVAEFTPKTIQTPQLRTSLVYEMRVYVRDPHDQLRLGMPATVRIDLASKAQRPEYAPTTAPAEMQTAPTTMPGATTTTQAAPTSVPAGEPESRSNE